MNVPTFLLKSSTLLRGTRRRLMLPLFVTFYFLQIFSIPPSEAEDEGSLLRHDRDDCCRPTGSSQNHWSKEGNIPKIAGIATSENAYMQTTSK